MGMKYTEVGGGQQTGLANDFTSFLQNGLNTGSFGSGSSMGQAGAANPVGSTGGIASVLNDILSGGAGKVGGSMAELISKQGNQDALSLRARYGVGGGSAFGTPAAYAEAQLRSDTAPKITQAIGGLQMQALSQILPLIMGVAGKGMTQREGQMTENPWMTAAKLGGQIGGMALGSMAGPAGAAIGGQAGGSLAGLFGGGATDRTPMPAYNPNTFNPAMYNPGMFGYTPNIANV